MLASILTAFLFAISITFAARSANAIGPAKANAARMTVALALLGGWAYTFGGGHGGAAFPWFFLSGVIGFGLGDIALFQALPRIGPRLTILLTHCLAAPIAIGAERGWLGTTLRPVEAVCVAVILTGVAVALAPDRRRPVARAVLISGTLWSIGSACGQGLGAVVSRKAYAVAALEGVAVDGMTAAYQRMLGGILLALFFVLMMRKSENSGTVRAAPDPRAWRWVVLNAVAGPTLGVACFQWALSSTPSGIVLPVVATAPVATMIVSFLIERELPTRRWAFGALTAVAGAAALLSV